jgi:tryptophan 2-monooxygenase
MVAAYELMKLGLKPVVYEASKMGGRLRSQAFEGSEGVIAEVGWHAFPVSSTAFYHYVDKLGLETKPFPNPLTPASGSTVIDLEGQTFYAQAGGSTRPVPEVADAWADALEEGSRFGDIQQAIRDRDVPRLKELWNTLVPLWDDRTFYDFVATSKAFAKLSFQHREVFGQVGFGTGGWDSDFPNSMLEIFRVVMTNCDDHQHLVVGGVEQVPQGIWRHVPERCVHWPEGTSLSSLHRGAPRTGVKPYHAPSTAVSVTDNNGDTRNTPPCDHLPELAADHPDRLRRIAVLAKDVDGPGPHPLHAVVEDLRDGRPPVLEGQGPGNRPRPDEHDPHRSPDPWHLPVRQRRRQAGGDLPVVLVDERRAEDAAAPGGKTREAGPGCAEEDLPESRHRRRIIGDPITVSWEADPYFLGAFKGALPATTALTSACTRTSCSTTCPASSADFHRR